MPIRALRIEIAKPLNMSWDELGVMLRTQRKIMAQLLRAGMDTRIAVGVVGVKDVKKKIARKAAGGSPQTMVYQAMKGSLERIRDGKWKPEALPALDLPGGMLSALSQRVMQSYEKRPGFNSEQPIPIRKQECRVAESDGAIVLDVKLVSDGRARLLARPSRGSHWHTLKQIAAGKIPHGDCRIVFDDDRRKWYALLAYDAPVNSATAERVDGRTLIVHRGIRNALTMIGTDGLYKSESGAKMLHQLEALDARARDAKRISPEMLGDGAKGHGKRRRYEHYDKLGDKRANVVKTFCQQLAARACREAESIGATTIVIEDYGGIEPANERHLRRVLTRFPLYQLKQAIVNAAQVRGLNVEEVPAEYISTTCPACSNADLRQHNIHTGTFHCRACAFDRPADFVAALNMLLRSGYEATVWKQRLEAVAKLARSLREDNEPEAAE